MSLTLTALTADRFAEWRASAADRLARLNRESHMRVGDDASVYAEEVLTGFLPEGLATAGARILVIADREGERGALWLRNDGTNVFVVDLSFASRGSEEDDELFAAIREIAETEGAQKIVVSAYASDAVIPALIEGRGFARVSIQMLLEPVPEREMPDEVEVGRMPPERFPAFAAASEAAFAQDLVTSGRYTPDEAVAESHRQMQLELPHGVDTEGQLFFTATAEGVEVGLLWLGVRERGGAPHVFVLDIEVAAGHQRRGYGRAMMLAVEREARRVGASSVGLHVFGFNTGAIAMYEGLGYRAVEQRFVLEL